MTLEHEKLRRKAKEAREKLELFKKEDKYKADIKAAKIKEFQRSRAGSFMSGLKKLASGIEKGSNQLSKFRIQNKAKPKTKKNKRNLF